MRLRRKIAVALAFAVGTVSAAPSAAETWYRADTHHFVILSSGKEKQLEEFAHELEQLDALMRLLFRKKPEEKPNRLTVYLVDDAKAVEKLLGDGGKSVAGFYRPRTEGSYAIANRERGSSKLDLSGDTVLFHEYAHHFMFRNFATPAPAWFVEGFAEFVSTAEFQRDGGWTFGKPPHHRAYGLQAGPDIPIRELLTKPGAGKADEINAYYGWSWALVHLMYRDNDDRGQTISRYFNALNSGDDPLEAASREFGDLDDLQKRLKKYVRGGISYAKSDEPLPYLNKIIVRRLSDHESNLTELSLRALSPHDPDDIRLDFHRLMTRHEAGAEAWYQLANLEFVAAHREDAAKRYDFTAADAALAQALALQPNHVKANVLKGRLLLEPFDHEDNPDPNNWNKARVYFGKANSADPLDPAPLFYFASSYLREGKENEQIGAALVDAFMGAPESSEIRYALARHLTNERQYDQAIALLEVVAGNPHGAGQTRKLINEIERMRDGTSSQNGFSFEETAVEGAVNPDEE